MNPRTGRPKSDNPKSKQTMVRFDEQTDKKLEELSKLFGETKAAVIRRGVDRLYAETKKIT